MDSIEQVLSGASTAVTNAATALHNAANDLAAAQAQTSDIAAGRWTLNNAVYQFNQLTPLGQLAVMGAIAYLAAQLLKKG